MKFEVQSKRVRYEIEFFGQKSILKSGGNNVKYKIWCNRFNCYLR